MRRHTSSPAFVRGTLATLMLVMVLTAGRAEAAVIFTGSISVAGMVGPFTVVLEPGVSARFTSPIGPGGLAATQNGASVTGTLFFDNPVYQPCNFTAIVAGTRVDGALDAGSCGGPGAFLLVQGGSASPSGVFLSVQKSGGDADNDDYRVNGARPTNCGDNCGAGTDRFGPFARGSRVTISTTGGKANISGACSGGGGCSFIINGNASARIQFSQ